jgi:pilus assembly protein CpaE
MSLPPPAPLDMDVAVIDSDPLWRVRWDGAVAPLRAEQFESLDHAVAAVEPGRPTVFLVGPTVATASIDALGALERQRPEILDILMVESVDVSVLQQAMRAGVYDVLPAEEPPESVVVTVREALAELQTSPSAVAGVHRRCHPGRLVVVTSAKSGEGASAVAVNLAAVLARAGSRRVGLVDGDPRFGDVAVLLGLPAPELAKDEPWALAAGRRAVDEQLVDHPATGLQVLLPTRSAAALDAVTDARFIEVVSSIQAVCDVVVLDAPFRVVELANLQGIADEVVMVTDADIASLKNTLVAVRVLDGSGGLRKHLRLVLNSMSRDRKVERREVEQLVGTAVTAELPQSATLAQSLDDGTPLVVSAPDDAFSQAVSALASTLLGED